MESDNFLVRIEALRPFIFNFELCKQITVLGKIKHTSIGFWTRPTKLLPQFKPQCKNGTLPLIWGKLSTLQSFQIHHIGTATYHDSEEHWYKKMYH